MPEKTIHSPVRRPSGISGFSSQLLPFVLGAIVFVVYLVFQFRAILTPPKLEITKPSSGSVLVSPIEIEGNTSIDSVIYLNEDTQIKPDTTGKFVGRISLPVGETTLEIKAINRFSRETTEKIQITVISK